MSAADDAGITALHLAVDKQLERRRPYGFNRPSMQDENMQIAGLLINAGANLAAKNIYGEVSGNSSFGILMEMCRRLCMWPCVWKTPLPLRCCWMPARP